MVKIWGRDTCPPCKTMKYWLKQKQHDFETINVDEHMDEFRKLGFATVPVAEVDGQYFNNLPALASYLNKL